MNEEMNDLRDAVSQGDTDRVRALVAGYQGPGDTDGILSHALLENPAMIPVLVSAGVPVDERDSVGGTILRTASSNGMIDLIDFLCAHGADVNASNEEGETPFSFACAWDQLDAAERLLKLGAHPNPTFRRGDTLAECAGSWSDRIRALLQRVLPKDDRLGRSDV